MESTYRGTVSTKEGGSVRVQVMLDGQNALVAALREKSQEDFLQCCKWATVQLRNNARKHTPVRTGKLRSSLRAVMPSSGVDGEVGYTRHYAPHVEYGHRTVNGGFVRGQYYLKAAVDETRPQFLDKLKEALK